MTGSSSAATGTMKPTGNTDFVSLPAVVDRPIPTSLRADPLLRHHTGHNPRHIASSVEKWRLKHPHDMPPYRFTPSPTFCQSSADRPKAHKGHARVTSPLTRSRANLPLLLVSLAPRSFDQHLYDATCFGL
jgi:hypothetical protein